LSRTLGLSETSELNNAIQELLKTVGVASPPARAYFNDREGSLLVQAATPQDLDAVEAVVQVLDMTPPQLNIRSQFIAIPEESVADFWKSIGIKAGDTNRAKILEDSQARLALKRLKENNRSDFLSDFSVTTLSDRQAQIAATDLQTVATDINPQALRPPGIPASPKDENGIYLTTGKPIGQSIDLLPHVAADGYVIRLAVTPTIVEFLGYDEPTNSLTVYTDGKPQTASTPRPRFHVSQLTNSADIWDGDTLVLGDLISEAVTRAKDDGVPMRAAIPVNAGQIRSESTEKRHVLVFITPTLIDPAGNRLHDADEFKKP
jgi:type II secretory pathway component GspD/PulD (secretin)